MANYKGCRKAVYSLKSAEEPAVQLVSHWPPWLPLHILPVDVCVCVFTYIHMHTLAEQLRFSRFSWTMFIYFIILISCTVQTFAIGISGRKIPNKTVISQSHVELCNSWLCYKLRGRSKESLSSYTNSLLTWAWRKWEEIRAQRRKEEDSNCISSPLEDPNCPEGGLSPPLGIGTQMAAWIRSSIL